MLAGGEAADDPGYPDVQIGYDLRTFLCGDIVISLCHRGKKKIQNYQGS